MAIASTMQADEMVVRASASSSDTLSSADFTVLIGLPSVVGSKGPGEGAQWVAHEFCHRKLASLSNDQEPC